jgi:threonine dehydrogenase-like Zn-dependent dehydrogenase
MGLKGVDRPTVSKMMKAAQWMGTRNVEVGVVPKPQITDPGDAIVGTTPTSTLRVPIHCAAFIILLGCGVYAVLRCIRTHCTISGSDIHLYEGQLKDAMEKGDILGQEAIGI